MSEISIVPSFKLLIKQNISGEVEVILWFIIDASQFYVYGRLKLYYGLLCWLLLCTWEVK